jgi:glycosyltransferase involved in cell wall biosynthesis
MHGWGITKTPEQQATDIALLDMADAVVVPSIAAAKTLRSAGLRHEGIRVIPYGIAPEGPRTPVGDPLADVFTQGVGGRRVALCIGTIGERKNQRLLVDALAEEGAGDVVAVFIGEGDGEGLRSQARVRGVGDRVIVAGHKPAASQYLPLADVLVLPSRNEGLPLAVLEALRAGIPVVAADIPEIAEALDGGRYGHLFPPDDASALARGLRDAADASTERRDALRARFTERYTADRMLAAYETLYATLASDSH